MARVARLTLVACCLLVHPGHVLAGPGGWVPLFNGKDLAGWRAGEHADSFQVHDGKIVCHGPRAHLFYSGEAGGADFKNFELRATVMTSPGADSGIYVHTKCQASGLPARGYEVQINNSSTVRGQSGQSYVYEKTGSLSGIRNRYQSIARDNQWFTLRVAVTGKRIRVWVGETLTADYTEPEKPVRDARNRGRVFSHGTVALECHDARGKVLFKAVEIRLLPDEVSVGPRPQQVVDPTYTEIARLQQAGFPLVDFHVHLKGGLTLEEAIANSLATGINYGIAPNCGLGFPITDDAGIRAFVKPLRGKPVFLGMQAEGREWVNLFSRQAIGQFDYVFTDAMTFTDDRGKRIRLWVDKEVQIDDKQAFMEMYVDRILSVLRDEPIDIYVNATFLPRCIAAEYDALWTERRMDRVIEAAKHGGVAVEINARYRIPSAKFIRRAKAAGVRLSFGTNNTDNHLGRLEYCLRMIRACDLKPTDMFLPNRLPGRQ